MPLRVLLILFLVAPTVAMAQPAPGPLHEARGTWLTTVWRLDWPPSGSATFQEQRLREIIRNIKSLGMNTIMFQVLSHGEAMYPSQRLPWANWLTGTPGADPGYDPLAVAIDEAHALGIELHAWVNVFHIAAASSNISPTAEPLHVRFAHPEWIAEHSDGTFWGNPALPEFRDWQIGNLLEIIRNYDIDGIHFDYARYPSRGGLSGDAANMTAHPNGATNMAQWRRENINIFIRDVYAAVKQEKPWVKVGSAPIGAYKYFQNAPPGYWAWDDLYQEGQRWLSEGVMDYVAPQLYFTLGNAPIPPNTYQSQDFAHWHSSWISNSNDRHVYDGLATWLETAERRFPSGEIANQIALSRSEGGLGQVHFRYQHTTGAPFAEQYQRPALPPPMWFLDAGAAPSPPEELTISHEVGTSEIRLRWRAAVGAESDPLRRYAVFRRAGGPPDITNSEHLFAIVGAADTTFSEVFPSPPDVPVEYVVIAQSLLGFTSDASNVVNTSDTSVRADAPPPFASIQLLGPFPNPTGGEVRIGFELEETTEITLSLYDLLGRRVALITDDLYIAGAHHVEFDGSRLAPGVYLIELKSAVVRLVKRLVVTG